VSAAQHQHLVLGALSLTAFVFFVCLIPSSRRTWFGVFAALNLLLATLIFGSVALFDLTGWRAETMAALLTELPFIFVVSWVCLAQAGYLPTRRGALPIEPVACRSRLRSVLRTAPFFLLLAWGLAAVIGLAWPSPAMQAYASAPPQFVLFKWTMMTSEAFYSSLAALVFAMAALSSSPALRLKNLSFSVGMFSLTLIALLSAVFAGVRLWITGQSRPAILEVLLVLEACLVILCVITFAVGLTLRYKPAIAGTLLRRLQTSWLLTQERFESLKWHAITSGRVRGVIRASHHVAEAAELQGLSRAETEKALTTIQLLAVMNEPSTEVDRITPGTARELYEIQEEILRDDVLASKISWMTRWGSHAHEPQTIKSAPLHDALEAALELIDDHGKQTGGMVRPLWYHLAVVSAADAGLIDSAHVGARFGRQTEHHACLEAYQAAKTLSRSLTLEDRSH
jgi:hypothetical protein